MGFVNLRQVVPMLVIITSHSVGPRGRDRTLTWLLISFLTFLVN